jgi:nitrite reductase/ring-hydroxylating ferredoxin subunit
MGLRVRVCRVDEVAPGQTRGFSVSGVSVPVLVANVDGEFLATSSMCVHEDVSLLGGKRKGLQVICPGHGYRFDLRTGACSHDPKLRLPCYRVTVIDGEVYADLL